jgi:lysozyme
MEISQVGINLIKSFEGCRLTSYQDVVGVWTIGYGHTSGVRSGQTITQQQADDLLKSDLASFGNQVTDLVHVPLNQYQFDALVSFCYNVGVHAFATSTLLQMLNAKDYNGASNQFDLWVHAKGKVIQGLVTRRKAEKSLFTRSIETPKTTNILQTLRCLHRTDIRNAPSHDATFVRDALPDEEFHVFEKRTINGQSWNLIGGDEHSQFWVDDNRGGNFYWVDNPNNHATTQNYTVRTGETLGIIAKRMNTTIGTILKLNPSITNKNVVYAGQVIKVPSK